MAYLTTSEFWDRYQQQQQRKFLDLTTSGEQH
jgi:hypothetical protein